ncbi:MAG: class I SAM-dependent methyltransferase [Rubrobacteraceae bacterium]
MTTQESPPSLAEIKARQQKVWATGDFARIGNSLVIVGELLCEAVDLRAGQKVLDVATGSGNTAISAARRNCEVTGMDYVPELVEYARVRAGIEHMQISFDVGDAEELPYPDASFDAVLSTFGVMFAPNQEKAASEMLRVCKPGGKLGLASWTPEGYAGAMLRTIGGHVPPPPTVKPPPLWGTEERLEELFGDKVLSLDAKRREYTFSYLSPRHYIEHFRTYFGPMRKAFESLDDAGKEALDKDLEKLLEERNTSGDDTLAASSEYLEVVASRK